MADHATEYWNGEGGDRWLRYLDKFEAMISPINAALSAKAAFRPGEHVVEIGFGGGKNAVAIAKAVAPGGGYIGVDVSQALADHARRRAVDAGAGNAEFVCADAQVAKIAPPRDRAFSSFGVMFFDDPDAAFSNIRGWVKPGGDFTFSCWAAPDLNPWMGIVGAVVRSYVDMPPPDPAAPGPFRMADPDATRALLARTGWKDAACELWQGEQLLGGDGATPESAADFVLSALAVGDLLNEKGADVKAKARADIERALAPYHRDNAVRLQAAAWIVTAQA